MRAATICGVSLWGRLQPARDFSPAGETRMNAAAGGLKPRRRREIEALGFRAYGQRFDFTRTIPGIVSEYSPRTAEQLEPPVTVRIAGRIETIRRMGKAGFAHLTAGGARLQIYVKKDAVSE